MFDTAQRKKLAIGLIFLVVLLTLFLWFNRIPKLDTVEADLVIATGPVAECFQGFCLDNGPGTTLFSRWWSFSQAYLELFLPESRSEANVIFLPSGDQDGYPPLSVLSLAGVPGRRERHWSEHLNPIIASIGYKYLAKSINRDARRSIKLAFAFAF